MLFFLSYSYLLNYIYVRVYEGKKKFLEFFDIDGLVHYLFVPPGQRLVISTCKFCRGCAMQFAGSGTTSGSNYSPRKSSPTTSVV
jgi:hypothetical protein